MTPTCKRLWIGLAAIVLTAAPAGLADAQWTVAYYQPSAYTSYYPSSYYTSYYSGWYPGYWLNRARNWWWGGYYSSYYYPTSYVASYPTSYTASYPTSYVASYPSTYVASYPSHSVGYSSCSACSTQSVALRPVCTTACAPTCAPVCSSCSTCSSCAAVQSSPVVEGATGVGAPTGQPALAPGAGVPLERSMVERPVSGPDEADEVDLQEWNRLLEERVRALEQQMQENPQSGAGMSPPPLYGPDGSITGQHSPAPVQKADYQRPAGSTDRLPVKAISLQQVKRNASGWTSASQ